MPVEVTAVKKCPSNRASRASTARQRPSSKAVSGAWATDGVGGEGRFMGWIIGAGGVFTGRFRTCASAQREGLPPVPKEGAPTMQRTSENSPTPSAKGPCVQPTPAIFKAYDIRGIVPSTLNEEVALGLGRAFGTAARAEGQTTVAVGRDGRPPGPAQ